MISLTVYEICAVAATLGFLVLIVYLVLLLKTLRSSLIKVDAKIDPISAEAVRVLNVTHHITDTVKDHLAAFNPLFKSISNFGAKVEEVTEELGSQFDAKKVTKTNKLNGIVELAALSVLLWQQMKNRR